jgi:hypothetical protein
MTVNELFSNPLAHPAARTPDLLGYSCICGALGYIHEVW